MRLRFGLAVLIILSSSRPASAGTTFHGTVRNVTTGEPAVGDDVILLRLGNGMEEEARVRADAQGAFALTGNLPNAQYVVSVIHQGVNYDQTVLGTNIPLEIKVFDSVPAIKELSGSIGIAQLEADGKMLKVTEMYSISNNSTPPVTQAGPRGFAIILPQKAAFDFVEARRGEGIWTKAQLAPVDGRPGHFYVQYPLRPGDTLIKFVYHLPYAGPTSLHLKLPYPIKKFAVVHPPSIAFKPARPGTFTTSGETNGLRVEAAVQQPLTGDVPAFEISGVGTAPPGRPAPPALAVAPKRPVEQHAAAEASPSLEKKRQSWLLPLVTAGLLLVGALVFLWIKKKPARATTGKKTVAPPLLDALKEELFHLEMDRARGAISTGEYAATKQALSQTLERAMSKGKR
jgi:hypothetical protein